MLALIGLLLAFQPGDAARVDAIAAQALARYQIPGMSVAIVEHGRLVYARGYGERDVRLRLPAIARTQYGIGSVTKQFVAAEVLGLAARGKLSLDEPIGSLFGDGPAARVTIRQLLSQRSGIADYNTPLAVLREAPSYVTGTFGPRRIASLVLSQGPGYAPGSKFDYSNANYILLGLIVERVTGLSLAAALERDLFDPLRMHDTALSDAPWCSGDASCGYSKTPIGVVAVQPWDANMTYAAGGLRSTVLDLARWDLALMQGPLALRVAFDRMRAVSADSQYGFGEFAYPVPQNQVVVWHDGTVYGFKAMNSIVLPSRDAVVVLANADYAHAPIVATQIENALWGIPGGEREGLDANLPRYSYAIALVCAIVPLLVLAIRRRRSWPALLLAALAYVGGVYLWYLGVVFGVLALATAVSERRLMWSRTRR